MPLDNAETLDSLESLESLDPLEYTFWPFLLSDLCLELSFWDSSILTLFLLGVWEDLIEFMVWSFERILLF